MHRSKLFLLCPISDGSGYSASIFTISRVMSEGAEEVVSWRRLALLMYFSNERGSDFLVKELMMETGFWRKLFLSTHSSGILCDVPGRI